MAVCGDGERGDGERTWKAASCSGGGRWAADLPPVCCDGGGSVMLGRQAAGGRRQRQ